MIFIACDRSRCPTRFLLTLHNRDKVQKIKEEVIRLATPQTSDVTIAEVLDGHVARVMVRTNQNAAGFPVVVIHVVNFRTTACL